MNRLTNQGVACVFSVARGLSLVGWAAIAAIAGAQTQVLTVTPVADTTILMNNLAPAFDLSNGKGPIFCGRTASRADIVQRGLVRFDLSQIPPGSTIVSAALTLTYVRGGSASNPTVELHRVLASWGEGASEASGGSGANSLPGDANWHKRFYPDIPWANEGGDFDPAVSSSRGVAHTAGPLTWASTARMVSDVGGWVNSPETNFGWLIRNVESSHGTARQFVSRESSSAGSRPSLRVEYVPCVGATVTGGPSSLTTCGGGSASFSATASGSGAFSFVWKKGSTVLAARPGLSITTSPDGTTSTLTITGATAADIGHGADGYSCVATNACGSGTSGPFDLTVCVADFDCDGAVDFFDYDAFVRCFEGQTCPPGKTADINSDGAIDFFDFDDFVIAFESPC